jgi:hypothetical protein
LAITVHFTNGQLAHLEHAQRAAWVLADPENRARQPQPSSAVLLICFGVEGQVVGEFRADQVVGYQVDAGHREPFVTIATAIEEEEPLSLLEEPNGGPAGSND